MEKVFDPKRLARETRELVTVTDEVLGTLRYGRLTVDDMTQLNQTTDPTERSLVAAYLMLKKAYPDITLYDVEAFPLQAITRLLKIFDKDTGFPVTQEGKL